MSEKDITSAYLEEMNYIEDKNHGIDTSLEERIKPFGFTLKEYNEARDDFCFSLAKPHVIRGEFPNREAVIYASFKYKSLMIISEHEQMHALVGNKDEIYPDKCAENGVKVIYTDFVGGTLIEGPDDVSLFLTIPKSYHINPDYYNKVILGLLQKYEPNIYMNNNDFMLDEKKVGGTSQILYHVSQVYGMNISFDDSAELASKCIPPRSIKPVGFIPNNFSEALKLDIIKAFHGE